jgi:glycosyltransferase involved in cell wall biosynthesis
MLPKSHVCIISQSHLCRNPRVLKEAIALSSAGYVVTIITSIYADALLQQDKELLSGYPIQYKPASDLRSRSLKNYYIRFVRALNIKLVKWFKLQLPASLGYNLWGYYHQINNTPADFYIVHQEMPLYIGCGLIKKNKKVIFDFEDWYSEDLLNEARTERPIKLLKKAEEYALKNGTGIYTTSHVLANALAKTYNARKPFVIYNTFNTSPGLVSKYMDRKDLSLISLLWFSQTLGPGRGIETLIEALQAVHQPIELHLRGNCTKAYHDKLFNLLEANTPHKLYIHNLVNTNSLSERIKEHDLGLALENNEPLNRDLTATNKLFDYLVNNVPVIATPTSGQREVAGLVENCIFITKDFTSKALAEKINMLVNNVEILNQAKQSLNKYSAQISWQTHQHQLLDIIANAIKQ